MPSRRRTWAACTDSRREHWTTGRARHADVHAFPTMGVARRRNAETRLTPRAVQRSSDRVIGLFDHARDGRARGRDGVPRPAARPAPRRRQPSRSCRAPPAPPARADRRCPRAPAAAWRSAPGDAAPEPGHGQGLMGARRSAGHGRGLMAALGGASAGAPSAGCAEPSRRAQRGRRDGGHERSGGGDGCERRAHVCSKASVPFSCQRRLPRRARPHRRLDGCLRGSSSGW